MWPNTAAVSFGVGLAALRVGDVCSIEATLEFFNYGSPVAAACITNLWNQATDWCRSYLSVAEAATVYRSTVTPETSSLTATETSTIPTTTTEET